MKTWVKILPLAAIAVLTIAAAGGANATGVMTCKSGPKSGWQPQEKLRAELVKQGWKVRRIKVDGGCYEVYAINNNGKRVESYFHPVTFKHLHSSSR